jgi:hypothetical protein
LADRYSSKMKTIMDKTFRYKIGWALVGLGVILVIIARFSSSVEKTQSLHVSLDRAIEQVTDADQTRIKGTAWYAQIRNCSIDLLISHPQLLRIGKTSGINLTAESNCSGRVTLPQGPTLNVRIQDSGRSIKPQGEIIRYFYPAMKNNTAWSIMSTSGAAWQGTLWISLVISEHVDPPISILLASVPLNTIFNTFLGLTESQIVWVCTCLVLLGGLLILSRFFFTRKK